MSDYFIGGIGKDYSYTLISEHPFVLYKREPEPEFIGHPDIKSILDFLLAGEDQTVYAFSSLTGNWEEVHFATQGMGASKPALGFQP